MALAIYGAAFITGAIVMSFEMLGSRYLNPYFGSGIYTWAALISTVLLALTAGYFAGGVLADRTVPWASSQSRSSLLRPICWPCPALGKPFWSKSSPGSTTYVSQA